MSAALRLLYEDERVVAVDKPSGRLVIPGRGAPQEPILAELERRLARRLFVVHRLDRDASGLLVFAKDADTHRALCALFEGRRARKLYLAAVLGACAQRGVIKAPLRAFGSGRVGVGPGGKPSVTCYRRVERLRDASLLEVEPRTGRRHQIRAHLYSLGHPVLGDPLYGESRPVGGAPRLMLHALELKLPLAGLPVLRCEPGPDFLEPLAARRL